MRLHESKLVQFLENNPESKKVFLLHGTIESKIFYYRKLIERKILGSRPRMEMRLVTLDRVLLTKEKSLLLNEMKTRSLFSENKGILLENVTEKDATIILETLERFEEEDAFLIITSGFLNQSSKLRKYLENNINSCSIGFYQTEMTSLEIQNLLQRWKVKISQPDVIEALRDFSKNFDFLEFRQELKKLVIFKSCDEKPLTLNELEKVFSSESNPDEKKLIDSLIQRNSEPLLDYFKNFSGTIKNPVGLITRATNQFNILHKLQCHGGNPTDILKTVWPPVLGKNKDRLIETSKVWNKTDLENALQILHKIDFTLRANSKISSKTLLITGFLEICLLNN